MDWNSGHRYTQIGTDKKDKTEEATAATEYFSDLCKSVFICG